MKTTLTCILLLLLTAPAIHAQTQEEIDEALKFYPLEVGNYWEYKVVNQPSIMPPEIYYYSIEVVSDTLLANDTEYQKLRYVTENPFQIHYFEFNVHTNEAGFRTAYTLERVDEETANVYRLKPTAADAFNEILIDSLLADVFETTNAVRFDYGDETTRIVDESFTLVNTTFPVRVYDIPSFILIKYSLAENFGIVEINSGEGSTNSTTLVYFRDHEGNEYGEAVHVNTPVNPEIPQSAALHANYPNPFNPSTTIPFELSEASQVRMEVYDMLGRRVALLVNETLQAGRHTAVFDAGSLPSGMYITRMQAGDIAFSRKMLLVK